MKRAITILLSIVFCLSLAMPTAYAIVGNSSSKDDQIDRLFSELNDIALQDKLAAQSNTPLEAASYQERANSKASINNQLESLGVHLLDPNSPEDMAKFEEVVYSEYENSGISPSSIEDKPNVSNIANRYSVYEYTGTVKLDNVYHDYLYYTVVDNKGSNGLTENKFECQIIGGGTYTFIDLLNYSFNFVLSSYLGSTPKGLLATWGFGAIFEGLDAYEGSTIVTASNPLYILTLTSVTSMRYYYLYREDLDIWVQAGSSATLIDYARSDTLSGNFGGRADTLKSQDSFDSSTDLPWDDYFKSLYYNHQELHCPIGSITLQKKESIYDQPDLVLDFQFAPKYYQALYLLP